MDLLSINEIPCYNHIIVIEQIMNLFQSKKKIKNKKNIK